MTARAFRTIAAVVGVLLGFGSASATARPPGPCEHLPAGWVRGFDFTSWERDGYATDGAARSLAGLAATGADAVALVATQYQTTPEASEVAPDPGRTPSDQALEVAVVRAKERGLRVRLRVLVDVASGAPRVDIAPADPAAWFAAYEPRLLHYAALAERVGVDSLEIGAELPHLTGPAFADRWRALSARVREEYHGTLSYGANWDEYRQITWWDALDEIGIDAYFPLALTVGPSEDAVVAAWSDFVDAGGTTHRYLDEIGAVAVAFDRPVVFAELGYPSVAGAIAAPWRPGAVYSAEEQETGLVAAFRALAGRPWFRGLYVWHWYVDPAAGGPRNTDHTVQGKPAEETVSAWFQSAGTDPCPGGATSGPPRERAPGEGDVARTR